MSEMETVVYNIDGLIEEPCESCSIDTSGSTWKVCLQCGNERITVIHHGLFDRMFQSLEEENTVTGGHLHDLDYIKSIMDSLEEAKTVLTFLFHQKVGECIWHSYDSQAFETYCNHKEVLKEIVDLEDCAKCPHYQTSEVEEEGEGE